MFAFSLYMVYYSHLNQIYREDVLMENTNEFQFNGTVLTKYTGPGGAVTIPEGVTSIGDSAFSWCRSLTSVSIPEGVTSIGESAFELCSKLTSVTIPTGVRSIGKRAFSFCNNLTTVTIPDSVTSIGEEAFMSCNGLTDLTIPSGVMFFTYCEKLIRLSLPKGVNLPKSCRAYRLPLEVLRAPDRPLNTFPDHKTRLPLAMPKWCRRAKPSLMSWSRNIRPTSNDSGKDCTLTQSSILA